MTVLQRRKIYGIDLDGVCFDFKGAFLTWLNRVLNMELTDEDVLSYYWHESTEVTKEEFDREFDRFGDGGHGYRNLKLLPGAIEGLKRLHEQGHKIYYITNRPMYALQDTINCLAEHDFPQQENLLFAKGTKSPLVNKLSVDVFIDDSPHTIPDLTANTRASVYCRSYKYNESLDDTFFTRVGGWTEFLEAEGFNVGV